MKAKFGAGHVGNIEAKVAWVEVDGSDVMQVAQALAQNASALAVLGGLAAWAYTQDQWGNPQNTAPLGVGPVQLEWEGHTIRGILGNRVLAFSCQGRRLDIPTGNIVVVHTMPMILLKNSRLRILLTDGSEFTNAEFAAGTALKLFTAAGEQTIEPKYRNRWNPFPSSKGYTKFRIVGAPADALKTMMNSLPQLPR